MWKNGRHPEMPPRERAKQFAPFAAVRGLGEALRAKERLTEERADLATDREEEIDRLLHRLREGDVLRVRCFGGGRYREVVGALAHLDIERECLRLSDATEICFRDIYELTVNGIECKEE